MLLLAYFFPVVSENFGYTLI